MNLSEILNNEKYWNAIIWLRAMGQKLYGNHFQIIAEDHEVICKLLAYFFQDQSAANMFNLSLRKGILLTGPIGCGKTTLLSLMRYFEPTNGRFIVKPCRDVSFEFIREGYITIQKYTQNSFKSFQPIVYCFDDLGTEKSIKLFGNDCNVMAEVLLSRYDLFVNRKLLTHLTTNLSASEIEQIYGNRIRSRMREQFNLIAFSSNSKDKRF